MVTKLKDIKCTKQLLIRYINVKYPIFSLAQLHPRRSRPCHRCYCPIKSTTGRVQNVESLKRICRMGRDRLRSGAGKWYISTRCCVTNHGYWRGWWSDCHATVYRQCLNRGQCWRDAGVCRCNNNTGNISATTIAPKSPTKPKPSFACI